MCRPTRRKEEILSRSGRKERRRGGRHAAEDAGVWQRTKAERNQARRLLLRCSSGLRAAAATDGGGREASVWRWLLDSKAEVTEARRGSKMAAQRLGNHVTVSR